MNIRKRIPKGARIKGRRIAVAWGSVTAASRMQPGFVIVGAQRCGTTSLYRALMTHPSVLPPVLHKGVNYFDVNYARGGRWYRGHFPVERLAGLRARGERSTLTAFEASGYYMFHPLAIGRLAADVPQVKLVALVRDPVERAYSAHRHELARGFETEDFARALELEDGRLDGEVERMVRDPSYQSFSHRHHAYKRRGLYAEQITAMQEAVGKERVLVMESERFFEEPETEYARLLDFLALPQTPPARFERYNTRSRADMDDALRQRLRGFYDEPDAALASLLGRPPAWRE